VLRHLLDGDVDREDTEKPVKSYAQPVKNKRPNRSSTLQTLIAEGWFKTQRQLSDIRGELRNRGLSTKTTTMPSLVLPLVLQGKLKRKSIQQDEKEFYVYFS
jgi:hypothetical protein